MLHAVDNSGTPRNLSLRTVPDKNTSIEDLEAVCKKLCAPNRFSELAEMVNRYCLFAMKANEAKPDSILDLLDGCDAWRRKERFEAFLQCCEALAATAEKGTPANAALPFLRSVFNSCLSVKAEEFVKAGIKGEAVGESVRNARKTIVASFKQQF